MRHLRIFDTIEDAQKEKFYYPSVVAIRNYKDSNNEVIPTYETSTQELNTEMVIELDSSENCGIKIVNKEDEKKNPNFIIGVSTLPFTL